VERIASDQWYTTQAPTTTHERAYAWASEAFEAELAKLKELVVDLESLEERAEAAGAPWTPGRMPSLQH
jgi:exonuclease VII small subunit